MVVAEAVHEDNMDGGGEEDAMQCTNHPSKSSTAPGGICAFCLQEKLGKLVSSSFPVLVLPTSSSSSSPSFRSDVAGAVGASSDKQKNHAVVGASSSLNGGIAGCSDGFCSTRRSRLPFISTHRRKKTKENAADSDSAGVLLKRSKSTATPRRGTAALYLNEKYGGEDYSPHIRRRLWSFLYWSKHYSAVKRSDKSSKDLNFTPRAAIPSSSAAKPAVEIKKREDPLAAVDENGGGSIPGEASSFDRRKVSRSRSVGCGSRSFSGDFFERISTGFGDCTLRRVESQREGGKHNRVQPPSLRRNRGGAGNNNGSERVRCGGIFSGFMITSSSSSSSSAEDGNAMNPNNKSTSSSSSSSNSTVRSNLSHVRSRNWGWALASPMRAFGGKPSSNGKRQAAAAAAAASGKNVTPNLAAIPSLLA